MSNQNQPDRVVNYKFLRSGTGLIAMLLPWLVLLLANEDITSISGSYWTHSGDLFVGGLIAVAFFLGAYNGTGSCRKDAEYWFSKLAGFFALLVALVPTSCEQKICGPVPAWIEWLTRDYTTIVHYTAAVLLFVSLFMLIMFFSRRAWYKDNKGRSRIYKWLGLAMVSGMMIMGVIGEFFIDWGAYIFWVEVYGLTLFGIGWLVAGLYRPNPPHTIPGDAELLQEVMVDPSEKEVLTKVVIEEGIKYLFTASGCWKDWMIASGPTGHGPAWGLRAKRRRLQKEPLMMLCGSLGGLNEDKPFDFKIGDWKEWNDESAAAELPASDRQLFLFANDHDNKYSNNSGSIKVSIYKLP